MARPNSPLPESIGRFQILEVLGRGGMGEVYKAFDPTLQRTVAVKTVRPDIDRPEYLDRMMREAQAGARLSHPNIVTVFEAGQINGVVYIAMEYLQGKNLSEVLETHALTFEDKIHILEKVLDALQHAHSSDVVHRDIKPSNIHVASDGTIKLMDFGLARVMAADTLTASGNVLGTPHYSSPEQLKGDAVDGRTDIYSTGVMAYEMLSGRRPFEPDNDSISSVILKVIQQPAAPMDTAVSRMLPDIEAIVARAMAKAPEDRYESAAAMRQALAAFLDASRARISVIETQGQSTIVVPSSASHAPSAMQRPSADAAPLPRWMWIGGGIAASAVIALLAFAPNRQMEAPATGTEASSPAPSVSTPAASPEVPAALNAATTTAVVNPPAPPAPSAASAPMAPAAAPTRAMGARELFTSADATTIAPGVRFRLIQAGVNDVPTDVDPAGEFKTGDRLRFAFESNVDGYLYVAQQGASGNWDVLFPNPEINGGKNAVRRFEEYEVPRDDWFQLDTNAGTEQVFVFLSREPLKTLPGFDSPVRTMERGNGALIAELRGSVQSRDLVFAKDRAAVKGQRATYVVNKAEVGKAVTASFTLIHK